NAFPGEVFFCPNHETVNGTVCINGSVPGAILDPEDGTRLEFENGHLSDWWPHSSVVGHFLAEQQGLAAQRGDRNWNAFAELGIGLNPAVSTLTGNSLFDEKALGTVHIAIGDNKGFGHRLKSYIHADMTIVQPTLLLDSTLVIERGKVRFDEI